MLLLFLHLMSPAENTVLLCLAAVAGTLPAGDLSPARDAAVSEGG